MGNVVSSIKVLSTSCSVSVIDQTNMQPWKQLHIMAQLSLYIVIRKGH